MADSTLLGSEGPCSAARIGVSLPLSTLLRGVLNPQRIELGGAIMTFRPLHDRVVVRRIEAEEKTKGGIIIPDTAKEKPQEGEIVAVGPGARDESGKIVPLDVKVGDRVLFGKWSGSEVRIDGQDLLIMKESDIMGVIEQTAASRRPPERLPQLKRNNRS